MGLIIISTIVFTLDNPLNDPYSKYSLALNYIDWVITVLFILEIIMKCYTYGILFNGPTSYLRNGFNIIDFLIVLISVSYHKFNPT